MPKRSSKRPKREDEAQAVQARFAEAQRTRSRSPRSTDSTNEAKICTSRVERVNLSVRMTNRRYTRLTNAFSKRVEMHRHSLAMTFFSYNFIKKHRSLKGKTPAMAAGIMNHGFTVRDMLFAADTTRALAA